ncbi:MAG: hypothetical protein ACFFFB_01085 [Candidatus Heimdallarchaeota archaeon]
MLVSKKLTIVFIIFYLATIIYLLLFLTVPVIQEAIIQSRRNIYLITEGSNYILALLISFFICLIGNASVGFPIPYPFILLSFSNSIYSNFETLGLTIGGILTNGYFWLEILGIAIVGGLGSALGELVSLLIGKGAKKIAKKSTSKTLKNVQGFGKIILEHPKTMYLYIFIAAALPIPDDPLWIALGMSEKRINFHKCLISAWMGKNITTLFYAFLPILVLFGVNATGIEIGDLSSAIIEVVLLLITLTLMYFIMTFDWTKLLEKNKERKLKT